MIKVVLSYIHYPMAIARYFEAALRRRGDVELYTVGPYTGAWIPWAGGMNLPQKYATSPNLPLPMNGTPPVIPISFIERQLPWQPDLWIQVDAGWYLRGRPEHGKNVIIGTDPHVLSYDAQRNLADTFYCMQDCYKKPGDEYLPYAYDPLWHAPEEQDYRYDACLIGLHYETRDHLVRALRQRGLEVYYDIGPVFDEMRALYNQAPMALSWSSRDDLIARVFEGLGMARLVVCNEVPDLPRFFEAGKDLITFRTLGEAVEKIVHYHCHPDEATKIATWGHQTVQPHTWDARIEQVLNDL